MLNPDSLLKPSLKQLRWSRSVLRSILAVKNSNKSLKWVHECAFPPITLTTPQTTASVDRDVSYSSSCREVNEKDLFSTIMNRIIKIKLAWFELGKNLLIRLSLGFQSRYFPPRGLFELWLAELSNGRDCVTNGQWLNGKYIWYGSQSVEMNWHFSWMFTILCSYVLSVVLNLIICNFNFPAENKELAPDCFRFRCDFLNIKLTTNGKIEFDAFTVHQATLEQWTQSIYYFFYLTLYIFYYIYSSRK